MPRIGRLAATLVASAVVSGAAVAYRDAAIGVAAPRVAAMADDVVNVPVVIPQTWMFGTSVAYQTPHVRGLVPVEPAAQPTSPEVRQV